ncbi:MAG: hypothetical protein ACI95C_000715 [Pseudohongiellaceae bacterium]
MLVLTALLFSITGFGFLLFGYLMVIIKKASFIAVWKESSVINPNRYATVFGWSAILCGISLAITAYLFSATTLSALGFVLPLITAAAI